MCYSSFAFQPWGTLPNGKEREKQGKSYLYINTAKHLQLVVKIRQSNIEKYLLAWHLNFFIYVNAGTGPTVYCFRMQQHPHRQPQSAGTCALPVQGHLDKTGDAILSPICTPQLVTYGSYFQVGRTIQDKFLWEPQKAEHRNIGVQHNHLPTSCLAILKAALWHEGGRNISYFLKYRQHSQVLWHREKSSRLISGKLTHFFPI